MTTPLVSFDERDISLWEILAVLKRFKWLIALVAVIAAGVGGLTSLWTPPTYEAQAVLVIPGRAQGSSSLPDELIKLNEVLSGLTDTPSFVQEGVMVQMTSPAILSRVATRLGLDTPPEKLKGRVSVTGNRSGGNTFVVEAKDTDPAMAAAIANTLTEVYMDALREMNEASLARALEILDREMAKETVALEDARSELADLMRRGQIIEEVKGEFLGKIDLLTKNRTRLAAIEVEASALSAELASLQASLATQTAVISTRQALVDEELLSAVGQGLAPEAALVLAKLAVEAEELNPVYLELMISTAALKGTLSSLAAEKAALVTAVTNLSREVEGLGVQWLRFQGEYDLASQAVGLHGKVLEALTTRRAETEVATAILTVPASVLPAVAPQIPVGMGPLKTAAVAGVLGLVAATTLVVLWASLGFSRPRLPEFGSAKGRAVG